MKTEELIRFLNQVHIPLIQIRNILVHDNRPKNEWGLLCCLMVDANKDYCYLTPLILEVRQTFLKNGFPAVADDSGIDFWMAIILIKNMRESSTVDQIAEELRDCGFDFMSACRALSLFFENITIYPPNVLLITKNGEELTNVICWP